MESTVDMIAASGPAMNTPAQNGERSFMISVGMARSPAGRSGMTARPSVPARCTHRSRNPMISVPMIIASCMERESL